MNGKRGKFRNHFRIVARKSAKGFEQAAKYSVADSLTYEHPAPAGNNDSGQG